MNHVGMPPWIWRRRKNQAELQKAGANFRRFLIEKYTEGSFTARDTCLLAFLHSEAGGCGAEDLGLRPETAGRHGAEHLRMKGLVKACLYMNSIVG